MLCALTAVWIGVGALTKPKGQGWDEWTSGIAVGMGTGTAAAVLTFLLIDMMLGRQRAAESRESQERERLGNLLARLRAGEAEDNRGVLEQMRAAGWLKNGQLRGADFSGANLESLEFDSADLRGAKFVAARLRRASFRNADVSDARFNRADLRGARFEGAIADGADFTMASKDEFTLLPQNDPLAGRAQP
jgi:Pentapeptide repeats (9 copies)